MSTPGDHQRGVLDADDVLALTRRLHEIHRRVDTAGDHNGRMGRWRQRLVAISEAAKADIALARDQLDALEAEVERVLR